MKKSYATDPVRKCLRRVSTHLFAAGVALALSASLPVSAAYRQDTAPPPDPVKAVCATATISPPPDSVKPLLDIPAEEAYGIEDPGNRTPPGYREGQVRPQDSASAGEVSPQVVLGGWFCLGNSRAGTPDVAYNTRYNEHLAVWSGPDLGPIGSNTEVLVRAFTATGAQGPNTYTIGYRMQGFPQVAYNPDDDEYLVGWGPNFSLYVQRTDWQGAPQGSPVQIPGSLGATPGLLEIVYNTERQEYLVLFQDGEWDLRTQRVSRSGALIGSPQLQRSSNCTGDVVYNWIDNRYLVVGTFGDTVNGWEVWGRLLNSDATLYSEFVVETYAGNQGCPQVAWNSYDNEYLVTWRDDFSGSNDVYARRISRTGARLGTYIGIETGPSLESFPYEVTFNWHDGSYIGSWTGGLASYLTAITRDGRVPFPGRAVEPAIHGYPALTLSSGRNYVVVEEDWNSELRGRFARAWDSVYLPMVARNYVPLPNDPGFSLQWGLHNTGQSGGKVDADIDAPEAWGMSTGSSTVRIGVIDSGVAMTHPEFSGRLVDGYDFVGDDTYPNDGHGHGTHVTGIAAARGNNGLGVAGVAWDVRIIPIRVLDSSGSGNSGDVISGIFYALSKGARVINLSLGGVQYNQSMQDAVTYVTSRGALVVAAAGNCGDSNYLNNGCTYINQPFYPAAYKNVLAVAATTRWDSRSSFSTQGSQIDVAAPGSTIYSTLLNSSYGFYDGTSQATPFVSGLAALIYSRYPAYTPDQVARAITAHADDLGAVGWDSSFGCGRINAARSLTYGAEGGGCTGWGGLSLLNSEPAAGPQDAEPVNRTAILASLDAAPVGAYRPGVLLVKLRESAEPTVATAQLAALGLTALERFPEIAVYVVAVEPGEELAVARRLLAHPDVAYAEPDYIVQALPAAE
jgi:subtilisin family serine protease